MGATDVTLASTLKFSDGYKSVRGKSGAALAAGQAAYRDNADAGKFKLARCDAAATQLAVGFVAQSTPGADQPVDVVTEGDITNLSGLTPGDLYVLSDTTAGAVMKYSDLGSGDYPRLMLQALTATTARVMVAGASVAK